MSGSLGLWCKLDGQEVDRREPELDVHVNLWLDLKADACALDVGLLLKEPRPVVSPVVV